MQLTDARPNKFVAARINMYSMYSPILVKLKKYTTVGGVYTLSAITGEINWAYTANLVGINFNYQSVVIPIYYTTDSHNLFKWQLHCYRQVQNVGQTHFSKEYLNLGSYSHLMDRL